MELTEDETTKMYGTLRKHCNRNCSSPYEHELTCTSCGNKFIKRIQELNKVLGKRIFLLPDLEMLNEKPFALV